MIRKSDRSCKDKHAVLRRLIPVRYPPKMIPGCNIIVHTSAATDSDARMLINAIGIPFYGKLID